KNAKYTGVTLMMVPVKGVRSQYLLVVPQDTSLILPEPLVSAFLRDYRKREPKALPFALLTRTHAASLVYKIFEVDDQGHRGKNLGPLSGFRLMDPLAPRIAATVPPECQRRDVASLPPGSSSGIAPSTNSPSTVSGGGSGGININAQANASVAVPAATTLQ